MFQKDYIFYKLFTREFFCNFTCNFFRQIITLKHRAIFGLVCILTVMFFYSCDNPFAPKLSVGDNDGLVLGDQKTVEGFFQNWRYSYIFKDTLVYGRLLDNNFNFIFRNYDKGVDLSWGRQEDLITTSRLFSSTQNLDLIWNEVISNIGDSTLLDVSRGFTLQIVFSQSDIVRLQGRANIRLKRNNQSEDWKMLYWRDESNF